MHHRISSQTGPDNASGYVLLSNIYAAAGDWDSVEVFSSRGWKGV
jgi:hypothetical protein